VIAPSSSDLQAFVRLFEASAWQQVEIVLGDVRLHLSKSGVAAVRALPRALLEARSRGARQPKLQTLAAKPLRQRHAPVGQMVEISAPHLGTFRRSAVSGASALVNVGDRVSADAVLYTLEVLDARMPQRSGVDGIIREIRAADGALVEAAEVLFVVEPRQ
jgi:acetyl-CoA carboxylase biotin carboxyl carrier protein